MSTPPGDQTLTRHVLVVDDDRALLALVERMVAHLGFAAAGASTAAGARDLLRAPAPVDAVLIDAGIADAQAVLAAVARRTPSPAVLVTSGAAREDALARLPGTTAFLAKPFSLAALGEALTVAIHDGPARASRETCRETPQDPA